MDKIARIRQEIERRKQSLRAGICNPDAFTRKQKLEMLVASEELSRLERFIDTISEEPDKSLEEAAEKHLNYALFKLSYDDEDGIEQYILDAFEAGAEWQAEKDARDMYMSDNRHYEKVYQLGKRDMKEQMLKDAVEGYVNYYEDSGGILIAEAQVGCPYHNGDKVRIIVVKEENK